MYHNVSCWQHYVANHQTSNDAKHRAITLAGTNSVSSGHRQNLWRQCHSTHVPQDWCLHLDLKSLGIKFHAFFGSTPRGAPQWWTSWKETKNNRFLFICANPQDTRTEKQAHRQRVYRGCPCKLFVVKAPLESSEKLPVLQILVC